MDMLLSQKNRIFTEIKKLSRTPQAFRLFDVVNDSQDSIGWAVKYSDDYVFQYKQENWLGENVQSITMSPGSEKVHEAFYLNKNDKFNEVITHLQRWLVNVQYESLQVDNWEQFLQNSRDTKSFEGNDIPTDRKQIKEFIEEIIKRLPEANLSEEQQKNITINLNQTINIANKTSGNEWWIFLLGILADAAVNMYLTPEQGKGLWGIVRSVFTTLIGS